MECYKYAIEYRYNSMYGFWKKLIEDAKKKEENKGKIAKAGNCCRMTFIYGTVACLMSMVLYGQY